MLNLRLNQGLKAVLVSAFLAASSSAYALECETFLGENEALETVDETLLCVSIPLDAPVAFEKSESSATRTTMLSGEELTGAADKEMLARFISSSEEFSNPENKTTALRAAEDVDSQLRSIEVFLKSGPAAGGPLTAISTGKED